MVDANVEYNTSKMAIYNIISLLHVVVLHCMYTTTNQFLAGLQPANGKIID